MYVAVTVAFWFVVTPGLDAAKLPVVKPGATVTEPGTVRLGLLLDREMANPPAGAALSIVAVQVDDADPCREEGLQDKESK